MRPCRGGLAADLFGVGGGAHLDEAERVFPVVAAEIPVAEGEGFLEDGVVGLLQDGHDDRHVVAHVVAADLAGAVGEAVRMVVIGGAEQEQGGAEGTAGDDDDVGGEIVFLAVTQHVDLADALAAGIGLEPGDEGAGEEDEVGVGGAGGVDAHDLAVGLGVDGAGEAVEGVAADAGAVGFGGAVRVLVELDAEGEVEGVEALLGQHLVQLLDLGFVDDGRLRVGGAGPGLVRVLATLAVDFVEGFSLAVIGLELVVADGPGGGSAVFVADLAEILLAQAEEGGAVNLGVASDVVVEAGVELAAVAAVPGFLGLVGAVDEDGLAVPVGAGAGEVVAALEHEDALAGGSEAVGERGATGAAADDDDVVVFVRHGAGSCSGPRSMLLRGAGFPRRLRN